MLLTWRKQSGKEIKLKKYSVHCRYSKPWGAICKSLKVVVAACKYKKGR